MSQDSVFRKKRRHEIAAEAFAEKDPAKLERLAEELANAMDERDELRKRKSA